MGQLPRPARFLTVEQLVADPARYEAELKQGGAIVLSVGDHEFRVTLEDLGEARIAALVANGSIPPIEELVAAGYEGDDPEQIAKAIREGRALLGPKDQ
jgi:hypothetical protein